jgi:hypothetical protein
MINNSKPIVNYLRSAVMTASSTWPRTIRHLCSGQAIQP